MFHSSSQRKHWIFSSPEEIHEQRKGVNEKYYKAHINRCKKKDPSSFFLRESEERSLLRYYEHLLRDFCRKFRPPMPVPVMGTACTYFKRFYMNNTVMDHHPKHIMLICVYLACKIEEFNVSISQFCDNLPRGNEEASENILNSELLVLQELNFQLTIHNPFRPLEGFLIDLKTRYPLLKEPELLRRGAEEFLHRCMASDAAFLFTPSQISLAAILTSASKQKMNIDRYVTESLLGGEKSENLKDIISTIKKIKQLVAQVPTVNFEEVKRLERKLEHCLNEEFNPESEIYKRRLQEQLDFEDDDGMMGSKSLDNEDFDMD
ncbi:cyclin-H-like [Apostichopus japonicus]|uniref:cyclin-H-like n=1 Tax=Stichopus japonicus TaxID=307972 RepID=UPI003AB865E6